MLGVCCLGYSVSYSRITVRYGFSHSLEFRVVTLRLELRVKLSIRIRVQVRVRL